MDKITKRLKDYIDAHPFDPGDSDCKTVLDQLYHAYAESHENDPREIRDGFKELDKFLEGLSLDNNNAVWDLCWLMFSGLGIIGTFFLHKGRK